MGMTNTPIVFFQKWAGLLSLLFNVCQIFGQPFIIRVEDAMQNKPLYLANVIAGQMLLTTDEEGFTTEIYCPSSDSLSISYIGYRTAYIECPSAQDTMLIRLIRLEGLLNTITVSASRSDRDNLKSTASISVLKPKFLAQTNTVSIEQSVGRIGGVDFVGNQISIRGGNGYSFGAGSRALLVLDGIPALQPDAGSPFWNGLSC